MREKLVLKQKLAGSISGFYVTSARNLKEQERQEQNRFPSLFNVLPRRGLNGGRVDLNNLLTSNEELFSPLIHYTNAVSGPVIESALISK